MKIVTSYNIYQANSEFDCCPFCNIRPFIRKEFPKELYYVYCQNCNLTIKADYWSYPYVWNNEIEKILQTRVPRKVIFEKYKNGI